MTKREILLGIDTSNYTTSVAAVSLGGELIANLKIPLSVREGERGLRQSDAVFSHLKNIPSIMEQLRDVLDGSLPIAVGVSCRPRNLEGSYMPCFLSGVAVAESIGASVGIPVFKFSHQCGHLMAAIVSSGMKDSEEDFAAFHVSGGTTEMLRARRTPDGFSCRLVGGTADINAGQLIDRVGVYMGMPFPAGVHLESAARGFLGKLPKCKIHISDRYVNLSGAENQAKKLYDESADSAFASAFVLNYVSEALLCLANSYIHDFGNTRFLFAGGVMSNSIIKSKLSGLGEVYFAEPSLSADNAVGIAYLARDMFMKSN